MDKYNNHISIIFNLNLSITKKTY